MVNGKNEINVFATVHRGAEETPITQIALELTIDNLTELLERQVTQIPINEESRKEIIEAILLNNSLEVAVFSYVGVRLNSNIELVTKLGEHQTKTVRTPK